jgi:hypothetical protein
MTLAKARIDNYDCNSSLIVLATVITIVNYNRKTFIVQATECSRNNEMERHTLNDIKRMT